MVPLNHLPIAVIGGRGDAGPLRRLGDHVVMFGSADDAGSGDLRRLEAGVRRGSYGAVIALTRWLGHSSFSHIRAMCRVTGTHLVIWPKGLSSLTEALESGAVP